MSEERDFKDDLEINRFQLDVECEAQPGIYLHYAMELADAKKELAQLSDKLSVMAGETQLALRQNPPDGLKVTEAVIQALLAVDEALIRQQKRITKAKHDVNTLEAAVRAMDHKKSQLDNLRHLWISGYYADPDRDARTTEKLDSASDKLNQNRRSRQQEA